MLPSLIITELRNVWIELYEKSLPLQLILSWLLRRLQSLWLTVLFGRPYSARFVGYYRLNIRLQSRFSMMLRANLIGVLRLLMRQGTIRRQQVAALFQLERCRTHPKLSMAPTAISSALIYMLSWTFWAPSNAATSSVAPTAVALTLFTMASPKPATSRALRIQAVAGLHPLQYLPVRFAALFHLGLAAPDLSFRSVWALESASCKL